MTTPITIQCKSCEKTLKVPASLIGKTGNCPSCKAEMKFEPTKLPSQKAATSLSPIIIQCKSCEETLKVPASLIGKTGKCPSCKAEMKFVPAPLPMNRIPVVLPTGMASGTAPRASAPLPKPALVKKGHDTALVLTAVLFGLPLVACGGCLGLALVFAPSKEVRERMRVEQAARNAEADAAKATEAALDLKAALASPALTGTPTAPTATLRTNTNQLATTEFTRNEIAASGPGTSIIVASRSSLAAIVSPVNTQTVLLIEAGREGLFKFSTANLTAFVALDSQQGIYVAPTAAPTGASGAWVRAFDGAANAKWWGAKGDGVTDDTVSLQAALDYVCTATSPCTELHISAGTYRVTNVNITTAMGVTIRGDGRIRTAIRATSTNPALSINGLWFSKIEGIAFETETNLTNKGVVEQDGNYDLVNVQGTQGITWSDCWFDGRGTNSGGLSTYCFAMNRQGGSAAQGSECVFVNCHWLGASTACYFQVGYNALNNTILGGNFQVYSKHAVYTIGGITNLYSVGFQSTYGYKQVINDGFDIDVGTSGANEGMVVSGCRTESMRLIRAGGANRIDVRACVGVLSLSPWFASTPFGLAQAQGKAIQVQALDRIFVAITEGTSGSVEPTWPTDGVSTVADGTIVWQELIYDFIDVGRGSVDRFTCGSDGGRIKFPEVNIVAQVSATYKVKVTDNYIFVDATAGPVTITLPLDGGGPDVEVNAGHTFTVKKVDASANAVTIVSPVIGFENGGGGYLIPGGAVAARTFVLGNIAAGVTRWILVAKD